MAASAWGQAPGAAAANESVRIFAETKPAEEATSKPASKAEAAGGIDSAPEVSGEGSDADRRENAVLPPLSPQEDEELGASADGGGAGAWWKTLGALALVIALVFGLKWLLQRYTRGGRVAGAPGAIEVMSKTAVSARQSVLLLRVGSRLLVVAAGGDQMNTLTEIDDPEQVSELLGAVQRAKAGSLTNTFANALRGRQAEFENESMPTGEDDYAARSTPAGGAADQMRSLIAKVRGFGSPRRKPR